MRSEIELTPKNVKKRESEYSSFSVSSKYGVSDITQSWGFGKFYLELESFDNVYVIRIFIRSFLGRKVYSLTLPKK